MDFFGLSSLGLWWLVLIFLAGAALVWWTGFRISIYADAISDRTGIGKAFIGALLIGVITSLPEVATTITATYIQNISLATNNIIGGVMLQVTILAIADFFVKRTGATNALTKSRILLQGMLFIIMLCITIAGATVTDTAFFGIGLWMWGIFFIGLLSFYLIHRFQRADIHLSVEEPEKKEIIEQLKEGKEEIMEQHPSLSNTKLYLYTALLALGLLVGGYFCSRTADLLADQTGMGANFMGVFFLALATSLPELSTCISAVRIRQYEMAFGDIFGTNIFTIMLLFFMDMLYGEGLVLNEIKEFSIVGAAIGVALTAIYMVGIITKSRKQIANLGPDSVAVIAVYLAGLYLLYTIK